jgi:hypothetical protein
MCRNLPPFMFTLGLILIFGVRSLTETSFGTLTLECSPSTSSSDLDSRRREATQPLPKPARGQPATGAPS